MILYDINISVICKKYLQIIHHLDKQWKHEFIRVLIYSGIWQLNYFYMYNLLYIYTLHNCMHTL